VALKVLFFCGHCGHWCLEVKAMIARSFCTRRPSPVQLAAGLLLIALLIPAVLASQVTRSWAVHYDQGVSQGSGCSSSFFPAGGPNSQHDLAADAAGNAYFTGVTHAGATADILTVKYNSQGVVQWAVSYDSGSADCGHAVTVDGSGNVYVAGQSWTETDYGEQGYVRVVKYNASGVEQWSTWYVWGILSGGFAVAVDGSGNVYVAGEYYATDDRHLMMTLKLNAAGAIQWVRMPFYGYDYEESSAHDLALDGSGNAYVTGFLFKPFEPDGYDYLTVKYSPSGATLWTRAYDTGGFETGYDVAVDGSGNVHVAGTAGVVRYNSAGTLQWVGPFDGVANALIQTGGFVYATGVSGSDIVTARYDGTGARLWSTSYNLGGTEEAQALRLVGNNLYVAGRSNTDALLVGFDKDSGASTLADLYDSGLDDRAYSMAFTGTSDFWVAGRTFENYQSDYLTIKYTVASGPALSALTLAPATFAGGCQTSTGKVTLTAPAPAGGAVVTITDTNPAAGMPASVTGPAGATTAKFTITGVAVAAKQSGTVTASYGGVSKSATVTVRPIGVKTLTLSPNPVVGPNSVTGTVTLECPAAPSSITVALTSSNTAVATTVPSLSIPAGSTTGTFTVTAKDVSVVSSANIKALANGISRTVTLTVNP
jgi:hypothetical protein